MNMGSITGFYYDEEKKKYFKIQANHQAPKDAKYSKGSIQQDKRESKKRKLEDRRRQHVRTQTVRRPGVLASSLAADIGLHREHGAREPARSLIDRDAAIVRSLEPCAVRSIRAGPLGFKHVEISGMEFCARSQEGIFALRSAHARNGGGRTYTLHKCPLQYLEQGGSVSDAPLLENMGGPYAAFGSPVTSISTADIGDEILLFASAEQRASPGNVFSGRLIPDEVNSPYDDFSSLYNLATSNFATLGTVPATSLWQTSINPAKDTVAVAGTLGVWSLDLACTLKDRLSITRGDYADPEDDETRAVDWLDHHTIVAGSEQVYLWDQRSGGASQRFRCKGRVTGIQNPDRGIFRSDDAVGGQTLLISTNRFINLFDVRYVSKSKPLLSWRHEHEGPQISLTSNGQGLFAVVDRDQYVYVYSTRTGGEVARLGRAGRGPVANLRWCDSWGGRMGLRALQEGGLVEWRWGEDD